MTWEPDGALARCFFDFVRTASCETCGFETIFRRVSSNNALETIIPFGTSLKKSKKRQAIASVGSEALGSCRLAKGRFGSSWEVLGELGKLRGSSQRVNI